MADPTADTDLLLPVRFLNEYVYCPRLAYLEWVQAEFAPSPDTVDGTLRHRRVDQPSGQLPETPAEDQPIHATSVALSSATLGITARLDLVQGEGDEVQPVDYKRGKRPHVAAGAYDPERVQLCAQGLLLREHGYTSEAGWIYYQSSRERVKVPFDEPLIRLTQDAIAGARAMAAGDTPPPPLEDSPKCPRCSLVGICLPDEVRFLRQAGPPPRLILPAHDRALPLYVQSPRAYVRKQGERIVVEVEKEKVAEARLNDTSQLVLFGSSSLTAPLLHECFRREIPVTWMSYGGWFLGHTVGTGHRNVETRTHQYRASFDPQACLALARGWVAAKIANGRTLLRRNWRLDDGPPDALLAALKDDLERVQGCEALDRLLGVEGAAAARYFGAFSALLKPAADTPWAFDFQGRNRRPPKDPVNALLSFAYALLVREWTVTLSAVGLDPYRGFYHQPRFGRPALALDMMEPFRPLVADSTVITVLNNGEIEPSDFIRSAGGCAMKERARKQLIAAFERRLEQEVTHPIFGYRVSYRRLFEVQARLLIRHLSGELEDYPNFVTR
ncbi:CRISPR-associated endonuclease Cas4g/Cas1g [Candidatus Methylocalor cossyra]|uniref:CRISPR-associated endonuclease Cas1 n=1 Tax=Candidatus Methylocalor cossyra TaxID=3108543 RepID=A0ABM9NK80_9GAMM